MLTVLTEMTVDISQNPIGRSENIPYAQHESRIQFVNVF